MIFNLISKAKDLFINRDKTGVAADNVEDAISVLNSDKANKSGWTANKVICSNGNGNLVASTNITTTELEYLNGVTSNLQTQLNGKLTNNLTASRALVSNADGKVTVSAVTATELGYLDGVTSKVQTQLNNKQTIANANNQTNLLSSTQVTTSTKRITFADSVYNYNMFVVKITLTQGYVKTYTIPYCCYDTKCHEISIFYNFTSYYEIIEFQLKSGTTADITIVAQGTNSDWNNGVYIEIYGVGKR